MYEENLCLCKNTKEEILHIFFSINLQPQFKGIESFCYLIFQVTHKQKTESRRKRVSEGKGF